MKKLIVCGCLLSFLLVSLASAEMFKFARFHFPERQLKTSDKASGNALWQSRTSSKKVVSGGQTYLKIVEDGTGITGKDKTAKTWHTEAFYKLNGDRITPYQGTIVYKNPAGQVLTTINKYYFTDQNKVVVKINGTEKTFDLKPDLIDKELLGTALTNFPFAEQRDLVFYLLTNEPTVYKMTLKNLGTETLTVGGKPVACYKIQMIPDLGALGLLGAFVPKTYFWYTADDQEFVRYEGLESGLGTPYIVMEAVF